MNYMLEEIELMLGPRDKFIPTRDNIKLIKQWATLKGFKVHDIDKMSNVELVNLYQIKGDVKPKEDINDVIIKTLEAVNAPGFEVSLTRRIARSEMQQEILSGETTRKLIKETLENLAPRRLEIVTPQFSTQLTGLHHYITETIIRIIYLNHPVMMVGPAGCGKTTIAQHAATALQLPFYITSTINDTHELTGFIDGYGKYHTTPFRQAFEFGGIWVADEIDAWDAAALLAANSALANGYSTFPDRDAPIYRHANFRMVATANTFGNGANRIYIGRNELDAATLDRFATIDVDYDLNLERSFCNGNTEWLNHVWEIRKKVDEKKIRHVVSTRAIIMGSVALASGLTWTDVENIYLFKGMSANDREKIQDDD